MAKDQFRLEGFAECMNALQELSKRVQTGVGKRSLQVPAKIVTEAARSRAPISTDPRNPSIGSLKRSLKVATHKGKRNSPSVAVMAIDPAAARTEYGRTNQAATPWFRPAVDATHHEALIAFGQALKQEVEDAARRASRRAAKAK